MTGPGIYGILRSGEDTGLGPGLKRTTNRFVIRAMKAMWGKKALAVAALGWLLAGCTTTSREALDANDPFEPMNRAVFTFDEKFDKYVVLPAAGFYLGYVPVPIRKGLHNAVANLNSPVTFANDLFQGEVGQAGRTLGRFGLNSTVGLGGLVDVATPAGLTAHRSDFGQTLARFGIGEGPFVVLPIIGPEPPRDMVGDAVDLAIDPLTYLPGSLPLGDRIGIAIGFHVVNPFERHARNIFLRQELEKDSLDPYATMRSTYRQVRAREIAGDRPTLDEPVQNTRH
ncbi:MAG: VacJ family lipoprotein [Rhizomicrobium sp.]